MTGEIRPSSRARRRVLLRAAVAVVLGAVVVATLEVRVNDGARRNEPADPGASPSLALPVSLPPVDAASAPTEADAQRIAAEFGHEVRVEAADSETREVYALPSGEFRLSQSNVPVRVKSGAGDWIPIDLNLTQSGKAVQPAASAVPVRFSGGGDDVLAQVQSRDGSWVRMTWPHGKLPEPTIDGSSATYRSVLPRVSLVLQATSTGLSTVFVVESPDALRDPRVATLALGVEGATLSSAQDGGSLLTSESDGSVMMSVPLWWDSKSGGSAADAGDLGVRRPLGVELSDRRMTLDVAGAAAEPDLQYPLYIDPSWSSSSVNRTYTDSAYPNTSYWNSAGAPDAYQRVGFIPSYWASDDGKDHTTRSYFQFDPSYLGGAAWIASAYFNVALYYSSSCTPTEVQLWMTGNIPPWVTWNNQPAPETWLGTQSAAAGYNASCPAAMLGFDARPAAQFGATYPFWALWFMLRASAEWDPLSWKKFGHVATLDVVFTRPPAMATIGNSSCNRYPGLAQGDVLHIGDRRWSQNGRYFLAMEGDGNLILWRAGTPGVLWPGSTPIWISGTAGAGKAAALQGDGNFVIYNASGSIIWATWAPGSAVAIQNNGDLNQLAGDGRSVWSTGTWDPAFGAEPAAVCYTNNPQPILQTLAADNNGGYAVGYQFELYAGTAMALVWASPLSSPTTGGATAQVPIPLGEGAYSYRARGCVTEPADGKVVCGDWSWLRGFIVDTTPPAAPVVTPVAGDASMSASTFFGTVGKSTSTVRFSAGSPATDNIAGYVYQVLPTAADGTLTSVAAGVFPSNPHCGINMTGYSVVCLNTADQTLDATVAALDERSQISVMAFDMAGNATAASGVNSVQLNAKPDVTAIKAGHSWTTDALGSGACPQGTFADNAPSGGTGLIVSGTACRVPAIAGLPLDPSEQVAALRFTGSADGVAWTNTGALNTTQSFSVGAWMYPSSDSGAYTAALAQDGGTTSAFLVMLAEGRWRFCTQPVDGAWSGTCVDSVNMAALDTWTFVAGVWDAINHQIRLYVSSDGATYTPTVAGVDQVVATGAPFTVGRGKTNGVYTYWNGQISNPFAVQGVISTSTYEYLGQMRMPTNTMPDIP